MQDPNQDAAEAFRTLGAHLQAMANAADQIEDILINWAQQWCTKTVQEAMANDSHRTQRLQSGGSYYQILEEMDAAYTQLPGRIRTGFEKTCWRHLYVDPARDGSANMMSDLDYGIWQDTGYKIPPAYELTIMKELGRISQLLRKYGYRPTQFGQIGNRVRHSAPSEAIAPMESYYRLNLRLADVVAPAEHARRRLPTQMQATQPVASVWDAG